MTGERVTSSYLGFPLLIGEYTVEVLSRRDRRTIARLRSVKDARNFVRGYRRAERQGR